MVCNNNEIKYNKIKTDYDCGFINLIMNDWYLLKEVDFELMIRGKLEGQWYDQIWTNWDKILNIDGNE